MYQDQRNGIKLLACKMFVVERLSLFPAEGAGGFSFLKPGKNSVFHCLFVTGFFYQIDHLFTFLPFYITINLFKMEGVT